MKILFSCVGSSDPVRGLHDGSMLHITRHYRPDKVVLYISPEMQKLDQEDNRFSLVFQNLEQQYPDYSPQVERILGEAVDVSEFDSFYQPFEAVVKQLAEQEPEAEILLNLSSGTTQMKMTMALLAMDLRFRTKGIQVKNFEKRSGTSERSTGKDYDPELEIELNEDNEPDALNRCNEPELFIIRRESERQQIRVLLDHYNYEALSGMRSSIPPNCRKLVQHLAARAEYDTRKAEQLAENLKFPFPLYPAKQVKGYLRNVHYREITEYLLCLKLMQRKGNLTNFVLRLNPLVLRLQEAYMKTVCHFDLDSVIDISGSRKKSNILKIRSVSDQIEPLLDQRFTPCFRDADISIPFCNVIIQYLGKQSSDAGQLFAALEQLNQEQRNDAAHSLNNTTDDDIYRITGMNSRRLMKKLEELIWEIYPEQCDKRIFDIYDTCNEYILKSL